MKKTRAVRKFRITCVPSNDCFSYKTYTKYKFYFESTTNCDAIIAEEFMLT